MNSSIIGDAVPRRGNRLSRWAAGSALALFGWRLDAEVPNLSKFVLVGAPHTSNWDFVISMLALFALGIKISWMGKFSLFRWPFVGILEWLGGVPIDRSVRSGVVDQTIQAFKKQEKFVIGVTPDATRSNFSRWRTGFYHIAHGAKVPVVVVRFDFGRKLFGIGPTIEPTGDITADMAHIQAQYAGVEGKFPRPMV